MTEGSAQGGQAGSRIEDIAELVKRLCVAITNTEMFNADHPTATKSIDSAFEWITGMLAKYQEAIVVSAAGKSIIFDGLPLEARNPLVEKLARKLDEIHVNNLFFTPDLDREEFQNFYRTLGKGFRYINEHGGLAPLLVEAGVQHILLKEISYVMVSDGEKVVSRDAKVVTGQVAGVSSDSEIAKYMVWKVLQKADEQNWLLNEMKNNPEKMADLVTQGIDLAVSRAEMGMQDEEGTLNALINNIRFIGQNLVDVNTGDVKEGEEDLGRALVTLENEVRLRSNKLMSSKVASGFVNEILGIVTSYTDSYRTKEITDEILKGEKGLKRTEKLLREMVPADEPIGRFVPKIREQLARRGLTENDLEKLLGGLDGEAGGKPQRTPRPKKPRKPVAQAVVDGLEKRLKDLDLDENQRKDLTEKLGAFIEDKARERAGELRREAEQLKIGLAKRMLMIDAVPLGVMMWDVDGKVETLNASARAALRSEEGVPLTEALRALLTTWAFPLADVPDLPAGVQVSDVEVQMLLTVWKVVTGDDGAVCGVVLLPPKEG